MADPAALSPLLGNVDEFFEHYWEHELLHLRGQVPNVPADLDSIDHLLRDHVLTTSTVSVSADGGRVDPSRYTIDPTTLVTGGDGEQSVVDPDRLLAAFQQGANIAFQRVEDFLPAAAEVSTQLTELVGHPVRGNMFFTPPGAPGLPPHRDGADVFVIQCVGVKRWEIWKRDVPRPLCEDRWDEFEDDNPDYVIDLEPGDLLYVPRGWQHRVGAGAETSLSTSFNIRTVTRAHIARAAVDLANESESLRVALQPGSVRDREQRLAEIREVLDDLSTTIAAIDPADLLDSVDALTYTVRSPKPTASIKDVLAAITDDDPRQVALRRAGAQALANDEASDRITGVDLFRRAAGAVEMTVDDTLVVVEPTSEQMITLNGVAGLIWTALAEPTGLDGLVTACQQRFPDVDGDRIRTDVTAFVRQAVELGVIVAG